MTCPQCKGGLNEMTNRFYGTGLAVHPNFYLCRQCNWVGFEPTEPTAPPVDEQPAASWLRRMAQALLGHASAEGRGHG